MYRILEKLPSQAHLMGLVSIIAAYFDSTITFIYALMIAFVFHILAGMRADEVKLWKLKNFKFGKFKDSLIELLLITTTTYVLKLIIDLMQNNEKSAYAVQILIWLALYYYFRRGLRNLSIAYPNNSWVRTVYHLVSFQFIKMMPEGVKQAMEKAEKEKEEKDGNKNQ
jgi:phosphatidylserine synthase